MRRTFVVEVDLDPVDGEFHTEASAEAAIHAILYQRIPHYNPVVTVAPEEFQPDYTEKSFFEQVHDVQAMVDQANGKINTTAEEELERLNQRAQEL